MNRISLLEFWVLCLVVSLLAGLLYLPFLGELSLVHEEPRRALIARDMLLNSDFWVPQLLGEIYLAKPPLYNWVIVASGWLFSGINEFSARVTSVVALVLLSLSSMMILRHHLDRVGMIFFAFAVLFVPELINKARLAEIELLFTLLVNLGIWLWYDRFTRLKTGISLWLFPSILVGLAFITKREPAIVFYYLSVIGFLAYRRQLMLLVSPSHCLGVGVIIAIALLWYYPVIQAVGFSDFWSNSREQVFERNLVAQLGAYLANIVTYPGKVLIAFFPFSCLLFALFNKSLRVSIMSRHKELVVFCSITVLINLPIYLLRSDVAVRYFLPVFPTLLVLASGIFSCLLHQYKQSKLEKLTSILLIQKVIFLFSLVLSIFLVARTLLADRFFEAEQLLDLNLARALAIGAVVLSFMIIKKCWSKLSSGLALSIFSFGLLFHLFYFLHDLPRQLERNFQDRNIPALVAFIDTKIPKSDLPVQAVGDVPLDIWYYTKPNSLATKQQVALITENPAYYLGFDFIVSKIDVPFKVVFELPYRGKLIQVLENTPN